MLHEGGKSFQAFGGGNTNKGTRIASLSIVIQRGKKRIGPDTNALVNTRLFFQAHKSTERLSFFSFFPCVMDFSRFTKQLGAHHI
jgi:hypothetical protein